MNSKHFSKPFGIRLDPDYFIEQIMTRDESDLEIDRSRQDILDKGGIILREGDNVEDHNPYQQVKRYGGSFNWQMLGNGAETQSDVLTNIQLMRIWCTQMFLQLAKGKAFTNEADTSVSVDITEEEEKFLEEICSKIYSSLHRELESSIETMTAKRKPKKLEF